MLILPRYCVIDAAISAHGSSDLIAASRTTSIPSLPCRQRAPCDFDGLSGERIGHAACSLLARRLNNLSVVPAKAGTPSVSAIALIAAPRPRDLRLCQSPISFSRRRPVVMGPCVRSQGDGDS